MIQLVDFAPLVAAALAIPQFLPQLLKAARTNDVHGVSWTWAALTSTNNAAWTWYFAMSGFWLALVPSTCATMLSAALAVTLGGRLPPGARWVAAISAWVLLVLASIAVAGRTGLGIMLSVAFVVQVTPAIWTAYRSKRPTGIAPGTWLLVLGELSCWGVYGLHRNDPRLLLMGVTGATAAVLMLVRAGLARGCRIRGITDLASNAEPIG